MYSGLVYRGPRVVSRIKEDLSVLLEKDGFDTIADAVGADHKQTKEKQ
jgi:dihydroorotate dehydrogenase